MFYIAFNRVQFLTLL